MKITPCPSVNAIGALSFRLLGIKSAFNDFDGGTRGNYIFFSDKMQIHRQICPWCYSSISL